VIFVENIEDVPDLDLTKQRICFALVLLWVCFIVPCKLKYLCTSQASSPLKQSLAIRYERLLHK